MIRMAGEDDIEFVVAHMRDEDREEIEIVTGKPAAEAVAALKQCEHICIVVWRGEPVAIFGAIVWPDGKTAGMFRFATPAWPTVVREAIKFGRRAFLDAMRNHGIRRIYAHTLNSSDTEWLRLFGAKELPATSEKFKSFAVDLFDVAA